MPFCVKTSFCSDFWEDPDRIRDLDNYNKALFDALTHAGVWEDDRQVKRMLVEWGPVDVWRAAEDNGVNYF